MLIKFLTKLKVLHINDSGLDSPRIVNAAMTGKKAGYEVYFCGASYSSSPQSDIFAGQRQITFTNKARLGRPVASFLNHWPWYPYPSEALRVSRQLSDVVDQIRPDLIHAHNIFAGHYASSFGIPMVLDDHELYSVETKAQYDKAKAPNTLIKSKIKVGRWEKYEKNLGERHPIITVSEKIADHHRQYCKRVFVVPNYPLQDAIKIKNFSKATKTNMQSVYLGRDSIKNPTSFRDISHLHNIFSGNREVGNLARIGVKMPPASKITCFGLIHMQEAYSIMQRQCHIGLVPWRRHWFHEYCVPNKVYEYAHCGLWVITIDDIIPVIKDFGSLCDTFGNYSELSDLLEYYNNQPDELNEKRLLSLKHARKNLIWEKLEHRILEAYRIA